MSSQLVEGEVKRDHREAAWALAGSGEAGNPHFLCNLGSRQALWQILWQQLQGAVLKRRLQEGKICYLIRRCFKTPRTGSPPHTKVQTTPKFRSVDHELYWGYLWEHGWGLMYRSRNESKMAAWLKSTPLCVPSHKNLGAWCTLHSLQVAQQIGEFLFQMLQSKPLPGSRTGLRVFLAAFLLSLPWNSVPCEGTLSIRAYWIWSVSETLWSYFELLSFGLRSFLHNGMFQLEETYTTFELRVYWYLWKWVV